MNSKRLYALLAAALVSVSMSFAQQELSKEQWQQEMNRYTQLRNEQQAKMQQLTTGVTAAQAQSAKLDADVNKCLDGLYALVGADAEKAAAYRAEIETAERKADELIRMSGADLTAHSSEVGDIATTAKNLRANKLSLIPEFSERLDALDQKVASLQKAVVPAASDASVYEVVRGDNLWNIARKNNAYGNGLMWPKIWKGNDNVNNPDLIHPGQKLTIPPGTELSPEEKAAAKQHYAKVSKGAL